jgi:hypothetical protein
LPEYKKGKRDFVVYICIKSLLDLAKGVLVVNKKKWRQELSFVSKDK